MDTHPNPLAPVSTDIDNTLPESSASIQHTIALPDPDTGVLKNDMHGHDISIQQLSHPHQAQSLTSAKNAHQNTTYDNLAKQHVNQYIPASASASHSITSSSSSSSMPNSQRQGQDGE